MAITEENNNGRQASGVQTDRPEQQQDRTVKQDFWSFHQEAIFDAPVSAGVGGEYFTKFRQSLIEIFRDIASGLELEVLSLNRQNMSNLRFSGLVIALQRKEVNANVVAFHTLVLEATGEKLKGSMRTIDNQQVMVRHVTSDAYDDIMSTAAFEAVAQKYPNCNIYSADAMVVPNDIKVDGSNKTLIENIARNSALACVSMVNRATNNNPPLDLTKVSKEDRFEIDVAFGNHQVIDIAGRPKRSSVLATYKSIKKIAGQASPLTINTPDNTKVICELSGFVNPIWSPADVQDQFGFGIMQQPGVPRRTQKFVSEFVVTNVGTSYATSPASVLLAISSFLALVDNNTWIQALLPRSAQGPKSNDSRIDITDIGALNITANIGNETDKGGFGTPADIAGLRGDLIEINKYIVSLFSPGVIISLDCPEAGSSSWYLSVFAAAAMGDQTALAQVYEAAMEITGGHFGKYFKAGIPMFTNVIRVPVGYYKSGDTLRDIRDIDYTAIANLYANNPTIIHEYSNTFVDRPGVSSERNLAIREGIISNALNDACEFTEYVARCSLSDEFVLALSKGLADTKVPTSVITPLNADQLRANVASPEFIQSSLARGTHTYASGVNQTVRPGYRYPGVFRR